jgi:hypothetical protein
MHGKAFNCTDLARESGQTRAKSVQGFDAFSTAAKENNRGSGLGLRSNPQAGPKPMFYRYTAPEHAKVKKKEKVGNWYSQEKDAMRQAIATQVKTDFPLSEENVLFLWPQLVRNGWAIESGPITA